MFHSEGDDDAVIQDYKEFFFNRILDCDINVVEVRFSLRDIESIQDKMLRMFLRGTQHRKSLTRSDSRDVPGQEHFAELSARSRRLAAGTEPLDALGFPPMLF